METRAPFIIIGAFILAIAAAILGFVYWLNNAGGIGARVAYQVRFNDPVPGLLVGAGVLFNGIRVGEVTSLALDPKNPRQVKASIAVIPNTPIHADTKVGLEFQGLTGVPVVALEGGKDVDDATPIGTLVAPAGAGQSMTQAAREALKKVDAVLADNAEPLHNTIANLNTFADGLARNTSHLDNIVAGLERMTGGGGAEKPRRVYDLSAVQQFSEPRKPLSVQMTIPEPTVVLQLDTQRILMTPDVKDPDPSFAEAQWADSLPKLVQARLIQSFENYSDVRAPIRPTDGVQTDGTLLVEIRSFQVLTDNEPEADISLSVKIVSGTGRVVASRLFQSRHRLTGLKAAAAVDGFNQDFDEIMRDLVPWVVNNAK
ncbi:MAG: ABC-type transport auxiliary lipoprotein family protein [Xanthobacteraceae bacterium]|nr:ABC-type transport auxiliary lipoprotein family protein [Xanthobacteraceae bacterium]